MKTRLEAVVEFLAGQGGEDAERIRAALADPASDVSEFLAASLRLSRDALAPQVFRRLGLPPSGPRQIADLAQPTAPSSGGRLIWRGLPWLTTALGSAVVIWLLLTCHCPEGEEERPREPVALAGPELVQAREKLVHLTHQLAWSRMLEADLRAARSEAERFKAELEKAGPTRVKELGTRLAEAQQTAKRLAGEQARADDLRDKLARAAKLIPRLEAEADKGQAQISRLEAEAEKRREQVRLLHEELTRGRRAEEDLKLARSEVEHLKGELAKAGPARVKELEARLVEAQQAVRQLAGEQARAEELRGKLGRAADQITGLRAELNGALADVKRLGGDLEKARQTERLLRAEITRLLRTPSKKAPR